MKGGRVLLILAAAVALPALATGTREPDGLRLSSQYAEVLLGDRLFFDSRFSHFFFAISQGDVNAPLPKGDSVVDDVRKVDGSTLPGPFRGQSMNCRHCHLGDDFIRKVPLAGRTYADFQRRSSIPARNDGLTTTPRNSPSMVDLGLPREVPMLLHYDGEFVTPEDLTIATFTGRNFGWLPEEEAIAVAHIARVIREDEGVNPRYVLDEAGHGISYRVVMLGTDPALPHDARIPENYRIDVRTATDAQILDAIARLMHAYMDSIRFGTHNTFRPAGSPYDLFLTKNGLPTAPQSGETNLKYSARLLELLLQRERFEWVTPGKDGAYMLHEQPYQFGATELEGLKIFLSRSGSSQRHGSVGNCVACHTPPQFTDHRLHNNGASQSDYDRLFGAGAFSALRIPGLAERNANFDEWLPPSGRHPKATGRFRSAPAAAKPGYADLGAWNVFANPDMPKPQAVLGQILCTPSAPCHREAVLPTTIALFKTASVRDLGQSDPYLHSGAADTIEDVLHFYRTTSDLARSGKLRNASLELSGVRIAVDDIGPLAAFLRSLNEDYR